MNKVIIFLSILCGLNANAQSSWSLTGNSGTNSDTNFIGTTDNKELSIKVNSRTMMKFYPTGFKAWTNIYDSSFNNNITSFELLNGKALFRIDEIEDAFNILNYPNGLTCMRIDGLNHNMFFQEMEGKVIIGNQTLANCSDCNQYKLFVKNGIRTEKVKVDIAANNGWADYVFAKDYKLMPLKELDQFINTNGHLPEVPTTEEAIKNGIELKEMNILLLKKIEELTLYTIEQQKRIEALENKVK